MHGKIYAPRSLNPIVVADLSVRAAFVSTSPIFLNTRTMANAGLSTRSIAFFKQVQVCASVGTLKSYPNLAPTLTTTTSISMTIDLFVIFDNINSVVQEKVHANFRGFGVLFAI